jgi:L,D-transpeptidase ErfK/SrfK
MPLTSTKKSSIVFYPSRARLVVAALAILVAGCKTAPPPATEPVIQHASATHVFTLGNDSDTVVGRLQITHAHAEDTLPDIARRFNIGYEEIVRANPGVDPWLPREGTRIVLPTQFVLPDAPHEGIVINLPALRLYYFPPAKKGEPQTVITHPIGVGMVGWITPVGSTKVVSKRTNPVWHPPLSVRKEHAEDGDVLPATVKAGPDNPLGKYAMNLDWPSYLIHGTNQPYGVGIRASHGCIRLYPEDIAQLFDDIPVGTKVTVVNQANVYGWHNGVQYLQPYPVLDDYAPKPTAKTKAKTVAAVAVDKKDKKKTTAKAEAKPVAAKADDNPLIAELQKNPRGIAVPVSGQMSLDKLLASAPEVENRLPLNATWDGVE